jgi:hypothetical protein
VNHEFKDFMGWEEREIYNYLLGAPLAYVSVREIAKRAAGKRTYLENPNWAKPVLPRMVERQILESDCAGHYRIRQEEDQKNQDSRWISPQFAKVLQESGKAVELAGEVDGSYAGL